MSDQITAQSTIAPNVGDSEVERKPPGFMSAVQYGDYGPPEVLEPTMCKTPSPIANQCLIRVLAASLNPIDYRIRQGELRILLPGGFPRIPGFDVAGIVVQSDESSDVRNGDRVLAFLPNKYGGAYAEYAVCPQSCLAKIPESMTYEEAAAIPLAGSTALQSLRDHGKIKSGDRVLINGASGGVGSFAIQIARIFGATVTAVASERHRDYAMKLGAADFIDYHEQDFAGSGRQWDLIFDAAGKSSFWAARSCLSENGRFVSTEPNIRGALTSVMTQVMSQQSRVMLAVPHANDLRWLAEKYELGELKVTIDKVYHLDDAAKAHQHLQDGVDHGKIVLRIWPRV